MVIPFGAMGGMGSGGGGAEAGRVAVLSARETGRRARVAHEAVTARRGRVRVDAHRAGPHGGVLVQAPDLGEGTAQSLQLFAVGVVLALPLPVPQDLLGEAGGGVGELSSQ